MTDVLSLSLAVLLGVASSFLAWFITFRVIRPRIRISTGISRVTAPHNDDYRYAYRVKVKNRSTRRRMIDVEFGCTLHLRSVHPELTHNTNVFDVPLSKQTVRRIKPKGERVMRLRLHRLLDEREDLERLPPAVVTLLRDPGYTLDGLFRVAPEAVIRFFVRCNDSFSGAPALEEMEYRSGSIFVGQFEIGGWNLSTHALEHPEGEDVNE